MKEDKLEGEGGRGGNEKQEQKETPRFENV